MFIPHIYSCYFRVLSPTKAHIHTHAQTINKNSNSNRNITYTSSRFMRWFIRTKYFSSNLISNILRMIEIFVDAGLWTTCMYRFVCVSVHANGFFSFILLYCPVFRIFCGYFFCIESENGGGGEWMTKQLREITFKGRYFTHN